MTTTDAHVEIKALIDDVHAILERHETVTEEALAEIGERMRELVRRDDLEEVYQAATARGEPLFREPGGLQLSLAHFPSTTAVHTHGAWGVMVGYRGNERYRQWVREDDGATPGHARLRLVRDIKVKPGDVGWWLPPPHDIHQQVPEEGGSVELILMGNPPGERRLYFDLDNDSYVEATPAERHYPGR